MASKLGFAPFLCIVFILLKLFGAIDWPWIMVMAPLWVGATIITILLISISCMNKLRRIKNNKYFSEKQSGQIFLKVYFESDDLSEEDKRKHTQKYISKLTENLNNKQTFVEECEIVSIKKEHANLRLKIRT